MKTTIDVSDALFVIAKNVARERQTTLRALVEEGLLQNPRDWLQLEEGPELSRNLQSRP